MCYYYLENKKDIDLVNKDQQIEKSKLNDLKSNLNIKSKYYNGMLIGKINIDKINLNKVLVKSSIEQLQKNIDLNNLTTINNINDTPFYIFAHYTEVKNLVFNRIYEIKINDVINLTTNDLENSYRVIKTMKIKRSELFDLKIKDKSLVLVTCTKDFNKLLYYCIIAKKQ